MRLSSLISVAKSQGQGLQIYHNYSNLSPPHHRATTACLPHICLDVAATLLHNQLRFNYGAMTATSSNKGCKKLQLTFVLFFCVVFAVLYIFQCSYKAQGGITQDTMGLNFLNFDYQLH